MRISRKFPWPALLLASALTSMLAGCNNDDDNGDTTTPPAAETVSLHGTAAVGAPIAGADVDLSCKDGSKPHTSSGDDGRWTLDIAEGALPCAVKLSGGHIGDADNTDTFYSLAISGEGIANISPLSDLTLARALLAATGNGNPAAWFANPAATLAAVTPAIEAAIEALRAALAAAGYSVPEGFDPIAVAFTPTAGNAYDDLLEAIAAAMRAAELDGYGPLRESFAGGEPLPSATQTPPVASTPLPDDKLGVSFDDDAAAHLWLQSDGQGGVGAIDGNGNGAVIVSMGDRSEGGPDGMVQLNILPNTLGTHACGDTVGSGKLNLSINFNGITNPRKQFVSSFDGNTLLAGYSCSVTLTHVGSFTSRYIYGDDFIEGSFTARLRQMSPECAGEGNCQPYKELVVRNGKFRINKSGRYTATPPVDPPVGTGADGILGKLLKQTLVGDYTLKCSESPGQAVQSFAFSIKADGSSEFQGQPLLDATHPGIVTSEGTLSSSITVTFSPSASGSAYVVLGFKKDGTFYPNSVFVPGTPYGKTYFCYSNSGHSAPSGSAQAIAGIPTAAATLARNETLNCSKGGTQGTQTLNINSDGSAQIGSESYAAGTIFKIIDAILFGTGKKGELQYSDMANGQFRTLAVDVDADRKTTGVLYATGLGPNDGSICSPQ